jgi:hypothetical protein
MDSSPTLQDFVLNLIYDPIARSAFEVDPEGVLQDAGLGDVTAADVQEVIPLVVDFAPLADVTAVAAVAGSLGVSDLTTGVADVDVTAAVAHLQTVTAQLGGVHPVTDLTVASAGAVMVTSDGLLPGGPVVGAGVEHAVTVQAPTATTTEDSLSAVHDPGLGLDGLGVDAGVATATDVVATVGGADGLVATTGVDVGATLDIAVHTVTDVTDGVGLDNVVDLDVVDLDPAVSSVVGSVTGSDPIGSITADPVNGALDVAGNVTSTATGLVDGLGHRPATDTDDAHHGSVTDLLF